VLSVAPFAPFSPAELADIDIVIVNEHEAEDFARHFGLAGGDAEATAAALAARLGRTLIATLGPEGAVAAAGAEGVIRVPALKVTPVDTTGAGDTFAGVLAAFLDEGRPLREAMAYAAIAGSLACTKHGAQPSFPTRAEIEAAA
jgi:ribokinase